MTGQDLFQLLVVFFAFCWPANVEPNREEHCTSADQAEYRPSEQMNFDLRLVAKLLFHNYTCHLGI